MTSDRKRPMRRLSDVLPAVASQLGLERQLQQGRAIASWERLVAEHVPPAAGASRLLEVRAPALIVSADDGFVAQELLLHSDELLTAFAIAPGGSRLLELRPVTQRPANRPRR
jgi:predicted nucleic acid-binding Zn ribbon protein